MACMKIDRVPHGYSNTCGVSKTGNAGTGTVLDFGTPRTPCTHTAVSRVFTVNYIIIVSPFIVFLILNYYYFNLSSSWWHSQKMIGV